MSKGKKRSPSSKKRAAPQKKTAQRGEYNIIIIAFLMLLLLASAYMLFTHEGEVLVSSQASFPEYSHDLIGGMREVIVDIDYHGLEEGKSYTATAEIVGEDGDLIVLHDLSFRNSERFRAEGESGTVEVRIAITEDEYQAHQDIFALSKVTERVQ